MSAATRTGAWETSSRAGGSRVELREEDLLIAAPPGAPAGLPQVPAAPVAAPADPVRAADEWRALSRWLESLYQPRGAVQAVRRRLSRASWPFRAAAMSAKQVAKYGAAARRAGGPTAAVQFLRQWWLCVRTGLWPYDYYLNRLFLPEVWRKASLFVTSEAALPVLWAMSPEPERSTLNNKWQFNQAAARLGFPHPRIIAAFGDDAGEFSSAEPLPPCDLFVKWTNSFAGRGVQLWRWDAATKTYNRDGASLTDWELRVNLVAESGAAGGRTLIVQRRIENHPALAGYSAAAACTARIVTARPLRGAPQAISAVLRMPRAGSVVDNLSAGGIAAPIELGTGTLGRAFGDDATVAPFADHPDSGAPIEGRVLPDWSAAVALVLHAHRQFPNTGSIGWDVAFTAEGPILIEANTGWGCSSVQSQGGQPLCATPLAEMVRSYAAEWRSSPPPAPPWAKRA